MKKIVIIHNRMVVGGPAVAISETIRQLNGSFRFYLVTGDALPDEMDASALLNGIDGLVHIRLPAMKRSPGLLRDIRVYFQLKKIFRRIQPQVVHTHGAKPGVLGRLAARACRVPVILHTYHGHIFHSYFNRFISALIVRAERWLARKSTRLIAVSEHLRKELAETYRVAPAEKIVTVPLLLNLDAFADAQGEKRQRFRQAYSIRPEEIAVGIIGRLTPIKQMGLFAEVVQRLQQKKRAAFRFFIIGDGAEKDKLEQQFRQAGISCTHYPQQPVTATVTFTSWLSNTPEVVNGLDVVCLTSLNEGTPVALIEAQAAARPVVSTRAGSVSEMIIHGEGGFLTGVTDVEDFAGRVEELALNGALRTQMGRAGRNRIRELYDPGKVRQLTENTYCV